MNSENISIMAMEPFINKFIFTIIKTIRSQNLNYDERQVIHSDLVPKFSESIIHASLRKKTIPAVVNVEIPKLHKHQHKERSTLITPNQMTSVPQKPFEINVPEGIIQDTEIAPINGEVTLSHDYGKITPLLNDPSVSSIECQGQEKPIMVIRAGQRQITKIILSAEEIKGILQKVSDNIHIPLLEGVFRAAIDNFLINAVISEMIGSRFIIKKQMSYSSLER